MARTAVGEIDEIHAANPERSVGARRRISVTPVVDVCAPA